MADSTEDEQTIAASQSVQRKVDEINEQGFVGNESDPTPNENYTVAGVTTGKPTPETDEKAAAKAQKAVDGA